MNLVINSNFRPFTYDEMVKPLMQYKEVYDRVEQDYSNLLAQTEAWKDIASRENNPIAYDRYNRYSNDLRSIVDDFSRGMNVNNRSALMKLKGRYTEEIQPIANASKKIEEISAEQRKLAASNPNIMFDRDFGSEVSIDQMIENPNLSYKAIDGNDIYNKGAAIAKAMSSRLHKINPKLGGQYWEIRKGFGEEAANQFLLDSGAIPELNEALNDLVSTTNAPDKLKDRIFEYARQGAISGMVSDVSYQANRGYESPAEYSKRVLSERAARMQMGDIPFKTDPDGTEYYVNTSANSTWKVNPDKTVEEGPKPKGSSQGVVSQNGLLEDTAIGEGVYYDPQHSTNKYIIKDGVPERLSNERVKQISNDNSTVRINTFMRGNPLSDKSEIKFYVEESDEYRGLDRNNPDDLGTIGKAQEGWEYETLNPNIFIGADENSPEGKAIKAALSGTGLNINDIEIRRYQPKGWASKQFNDPIILIKTKPTNSGSTGDRSNVSSRGGK